MLERIIDEGFIAADGEKDSERRRLLLHLASNLEKDCTSEVSVLDYYLLEICLKLSRSKGKTNA